MLDRGKARAFFEEIVAHRDDLAARLGRDVHLRVAAFDLIAQGKGPHALGAPVLIGPRVLRRIVERATRED